jgi:hypothetical protein
MASPLFNTENRPKSTDSLVSRDLKSLWSEGPPYIVSVERTPGLFIHAEQAAVKREVVAVPTKWWIKLDKPNIAGRLKIHLLPCDPNTEVRNGSQVVRIAHNRLVMDLLAQALTDAGFNVSFGPPSRFERRELI